MASVACGQTWEWGAGSESTHIATEHALIEASGPFDSPGSLRYALRSDAGNWIDASPGETDLFELELAHFVECVRSGDEPLVRGESARDSLAVCLAVKESARTGRSVAR